MCVRRRFGCSATWLADLSSEQFAAGIAGWCTDSGAAGAESLGWRTLDGRGLTKRPKAATERGSDSDRGWDAGSPGGGLGGLLLLLVHAEEEGSALCPRGVAVIWLVIAPRPSGA